jgi:hypothetical protein
MSEAPVRRPPADRWNDLRLHPRPKISVPQPVAPATIASVTPDPLAASDIALVTSATTCANCHHPITGHFCAECGAPRLDERPLTVRRFVADLWNEVTNIDSLTVRTMTTLFRRPGVLTRDYVSGRTRWYMPPVRLYLAMFALMIFARTVTHQDVRIQEEVRQRIEQKQADDADLRAIRARRATAGRQIPDFAEPMSRAVGVALGNQWLHLVDPLSVALVLTLLYRARRRNYAQHVVFALHLLAFNWALSVITTSMHAAWSASMSSTDAVSVLHWLAFGTYAYLALRRVYEESRPRSTLKAAALTVGAQAAMAVVPLLTGVTVAIWTIAHLM